MIARMSDYLHTHLVPCPTAGHEVARRVEGADVVLSVVRHDLLCARSALSIRVRVDIIGHARIRCVGKSQSCMVSKLPMIYM